MELIKSQIDCLLLGLFFLSSLQRGVQSDQGFVKETLLFCALVEQLLNSDESVIEISVVSADCLALNIQRCSIGRNWISIEQYRITAHSNDFSTKVNLAVGNDVDK